MANNETGKAVLDLLHTGKEGRMSRGREQSNGEYIHTVDRGTE